MTQWHFSKGYSFLFSFALTDLITGSCVCVCVCAPFPANNWPLTVWLWFRQHGKHWECMKSYGVQIVLKTITALSEPCGAAQCHAIMAWLKRSLNCGHNPLRYDSSEVSKVQHCLFHSAPINYSNTYIMQWEWSDTGAFSSDLCCHEWACITVTLLQLLLLLWFQFIYCKQ